MEDADTHTRGGQTHETRTLQQVDTYKRRTHAKGGHTHKRRAHTHKRRIHTHKRRIHIHEQEHTTNKSVDMEAYWKEEEEYKRKQDIPHDVTPRFQADFKD